MTPRSAHSPVTVAEAYADWGERLRYTPLSFGGANFAMSEWRMK